MYAWIDLGYSVLNQLLRVHRRSAAPPFRYMFRRRCHTLLATIHSGRPPALLLWKLEGDSLCAPPDGDGKFFAGSKFLQ